MNILYHCWTSMMFWSQDFPSLHSGFQRFNCTKGKYEAVTIMVVLIQLLATSVHFVRLLASFTCFHWLTIFITFICIAQKVSRCVGRR